MSTEALPGKAAAGAKGAPFYDSVFSANPNYRAHYRESSYYPLWCAVAERVPPDARVLEIGCGPGQLAELLWDRGVRSYHGFDFSPVAIRGARQRVPQLSFALEDAADPAAYEGDYDLVLAVEVLEHVDDDVALLARAAAPGRSCVLSVPTADSQAHVRFFPNTQSVSRRYSSSLQALSVRAVGRRWFLGEGVFA